MAEYSIWLLQTGVMLKFPRSGLFYGSHNQGTLEVPLGFVVIKGEGHIALVDTGYRFPDYGKDIEALYGVTNARSSDSLLEYVGIRPEDVDTILLTHAHWDHMGNLGAFPNAHIYLQAAELERWMWAFQLPKRLSWLGGGVDPADFHELFERSLQGRVHLVRDAVIDVLPGIDLRPALDTHTYGCQYVVVRSTNLATPGPWVVVGDCVFAYSNLEGLDGSDVYVPIGQAIGSQQKVLEVFEEIHTILGGDVLRMIPFHDAETYRRMPSRETVPGLRLAEIALAPGEASRLVTAAPV